MNKSKKSSPLLIHPRAGQAERRVHQAAKKRGLAMDVRLATYQIPVCTNRERGTMELVDWPFLLPSVLDASFKMKHILITGDGFHL